LIMTGMIISGTCRLARRKRFVVLAAGGVRFIFLKNVVKIVRYVIVGAYMLVLQFFIVVN